MRRVERLALASVAQRLLDSYRVKWSEDGLSGVADMDRLWRTARQTKAIGGEHNSVLATLRKMCGARERCMYCMDSHACDIEHFRPKARFPDQAFCWPNLLLCCTYCGRLKGSQFPMREEVPQLIDPTAEDPWQFIDFDPETGNLVPRFDLTEDSVSTRGSVTVKMFKLDRREALSDGYRRTFRRLIRVFQAVVDAAAPPTAEEFVESVAHEDEHGLISWCLWGEGQRLAPFSQVEQRYPRLWESCRARFA